MKTILLTVAALALAFSSKAQYKDSLKTFRKLTKSYQKTSDFVFIPSESFVMGFSEQDAHSYTVDNFYLRARTVSVDSFFIQKYEVSNADYLEFVNEKLKEDSILGKAFLPDTLVWRTRYSYNEAYVEYYLRHPAYANFPVVGVSYAQVVAFAKWKTQNYNSNEERIFKKVRFRIPKEEEWELASKGGYDYSHLPWGSHSVFDEKGAPRANFRTVSQLSIYRDSVYGKTYTGEVKKVPALLSNGSSMSDFSVAGSLFDNADVTEPVNSLEPNPFGLYHMAGNVEEMVDAHYYRDASAYEFSHDLQNVKYDKPWGVTKGGSWKDTGFYLQYPIRQFYEDEHSTSNEVGFRLVMDVLEY